jgi:hypothetical protein
MRYFTPELFVRGNSADDDVVDQVEEEWEQATRRYRRHYKRIEPHLPESLRRFCAEQCLHDADVFAPALVSAVPYGREVVIVAQQINTVLPETVNTLAILTYTVTADPVVEVPVTSNVFNKTQPIWLYDEVDLVEPGVFTHAILISDGRVVKLRFREFRYLVAPLIRAGDRPAVAAPAPNGATAAESPKRRAR